MPDKSILTPERRAELRKLCEAATPGIWKSTGLSVFSVLNNDQLGRGHYPSICSISRHNFDDNAAFIAAAREALPQLLDATEPPSEGRISVALQWLRTRQISGEGQQAEICGKIADLLARLAANVPQMPEPPSEKRVKRLTTALCRYASDMEEPEVIADLLEAADLLAANVPQWRDISSAPREYERPIIGGRYDQFGRWRWGVSEWNGHDWFGFYHPDFFLDHLPLPPPPGDDK